MPARADSRTPSSEYRAAERLQDVLATPHALTGPARVSIALTQLRMGDVTGARATVTSLTDRDHESGEARSALAALRIAEGDPRAAIEALTPVLDGTAAVVRVGTVIRRWCWTRSHATSSATA